MVVVTGTKDGVFSRFGLTLWGKPCLHVGGEHIDVETVDDIRRALAARGYENVRVSEALCL
jgi:hypothetical protein